MIDPIFSIIYVIGLVTGSTIRVWYSRKYKQDRKSIFRNEGIIVTLLASFWGITILLPFLTMFTHWLDFVDYNLPIWASLMGAVTFIFALWLLRRSHTDLGRNWLIAAETRDTQKLVTDGVFRYIRHPMYAAHLLWGIAQALLITNWIAGLSSLVIFLPMYLLRVRREEKVMLAQFGDEYRAYQHRTGRIIPRFRK